MKIEVVILHSLNWTAINHNNKSDLSVKNSNENDLYTVKLYFTSCCVASTWNTAQYNSVINSSLFELNKPAAWPKVASSYATFVIKSIFAINL